MSDIQNISDTQLASKLAEDFGVSEGLITAILSNWQKILGFIVIVFLGLWVFNQKKIADHKRLEEASTRFSQAQKMFAELSLNAENSATLKDNLQVIIDKELSDTYEGFAGLYLVASYIRQGDLTAAQNKLKEFKYDRFTNLNKFVESKNIKPESLIDELASMLYVKTLLADANPNLPEAQKQLVSIVYGAKYLAVEALVTLIRLSATSEDQAKITALVKELEAARPELIDTIEKEIKELGFVLK